MLSVSHKAMFSILTLGVSSHQTSVTEKLFHTRQMSQVKTAVFIFLSSQTYADSSLALRNVPPLALLVHIQHCMDLVEPPGPNGRPVRRSPQHGGCPCFLPMFCPTAQELKAQFFQNHPALALLSIVQHVLLSAFANAAIVSLQFSLS